MSSHRTLLAPALGAVALLSGVVFTPLASAGPPATLTISPTSATKTAGTKHCVIATVRDSSGNPVPSAAVPFSVSGVNVATGTRTTGTLGRATFCYTGTKAGVDRISAFADTDRDATKDAGEPSAEATNTYTAAAPAALTLAPATGQDYALSEHCVTATVRDAYTNRVPGVIVRFSVSGANVARGPRTTTALGKARFCYRGMNPGTDTISAFADTDTDRTKDPSEPAGTATKTWLPAPSASIAGSETLVFDWSQNKCEDADIPDLPARAFRDAGGRVQLIATHNKSWRYVGPSLDQLTHPCSPVMTSSLDPNPANFNNREWVASPYTLDGQTVYALVHNEHQGNRYPGCPSHDYFLCLYFSITLAVSTNRGDTYTQAPAPGHRVASAAYRYFGDSGPIGFRSPSNIVYRQADGYYYALIWATAYGVQPQGTCLMRTKTLGVPGSWRAWGGSGFGIRFANPYTESVVPQQHVCKLISEPQIGTMTDSLTFNTYLNRFVLVGADTSYLPSGTPVHGIYFSQSRDLIHWSERKLIVETPLQWTYNCGDPAPLGYPSVIDPASTSRNFQTVGQRAYLYFTRFNIVSCQKSLDRDLVRVPIEFQK